MNIKTNKKDGGSISMNITDYSTIIDIPSDVNS